MRIHSLTIIIPCYNEVSTIKQVVSSIQKLNLNAKKEIIIVDDGSDDGSEKIIRSLSNSAICLFQKTNQGKGAAIKKALEVATGEYVIIQDADLECNPFDIKKLITKAEKTNALAVFGSRNRSGNKHLYLFYYLGGILLTKFTNFLFKQRLTDVSVAYKLVKRDLLNKLDLRENRFGICVEIASKLSILGEEIAEVPISYHPRLFNQGKKLKLKDGIVGFLVVMRIFTRNLFQLKNSYRFNPNENVLVD